jgi:hypothetical protein
VNFETGQIRDLEDFVQFGPHIGDLRQQPLGIRVGFAAVDLVAVGGESVLEAFLLGLGLDHEPREPRLELGKLARMGLEVGMDAHGVGTAAHGAEFLA